MEYSNIIFEIHITLKNLKKNCRNTNVKPMCNLETFFKMILKTIFLRRVTKNYFMMFYKIKVDL